MMETLERILAEHPFSRDLEKRYARTSGWLRGECAIRGRRISLPRR